MAIKLLSKYYVERYRAGKDNAQGNNPERKVATGRARCRCCGEVVTKGQEAIFVYHDFTGCGSWTSVACWLHLSCEAVQEVAHV